MISKYDRLAGVRPLDYYLCRIHQFADFEIDQIETILFTCEDKQELIDFCAKRGYDIRETCPNDSWLLFYIGQNKQVKCNACTPTKTCDDCKWPGC